MASAMLKRTAMVKSMVVKGLQETSRRRAFALIAEGTNLVAAAPNVSLQKARTWDEGVSSKFSTTPLKDIFKGKKVVILGLPALEESPLDMSLMHDAEQPSNLVNVSSDEEISDNEVLYFLENKPE